MFYLLFARSSKRFILKTKACVVFPLRKKKHRNFFQNISVGKNLWEWIKTRVIKRNIGINSSGVDHTSNTKNAFVKTFKAPLCGSHLVLKLRLLSQTCNKKRTFVFINGQHQRRLPLMAKKEGGGHWSSAFGG